MELGKGSSSGRVWTLGGQAHTEPQMDPEGVWGRGAGSPEMLAWVHEAAHLDPSLSIHWVLSVSQILSCDSGDEEGSCRETETLRPSP